MDVALNAQNLITGNAPVAIEHSSYTRDFFFESLQFESLPPRREENAHRDARLAREMLGLTSMAWDDKYAR